jgi:3-oxoadipate enol-lactonase
MGDLVDDAARVVREWGRGPVVWVGLSMGGMVGQGLAIRHPELVRGLVIANSSARYSEAARAMWAERIAKAEHGGLEAIADTVIERYFSAPFRATHAATVANFRRQLLQTDLAGYVATCHAVGSVDWLDRLPEIRCPTLVIAGGQDVGAPVAMSEAMVAGIAGAKLVLIDDAAHLSVVEEPAAFAAALDKFLARVEGKAVRPG